MDDYMDPIEIRKKSLIDLYPKSFDEYRDSFKNKVEDVEEDVLILIEIERVEEIITSFQDYNLHNEEKIHSSYLAVKNYEKFLKDRQEILNNSKRSFKRSSKITHKQQALLVYYLKKAGIFPSDDKLKLKAKENSLLYSYIFGVDDDNTEKYFRYMGYNSRHNAMTLNNLEKVINIFKELGMESLETMAIEDFKRIQETKTKTK